MMANILLVEDDVDLANTVFDYLTYENHTVQIIHDGQKAREQLQSFHYDLIVLDWMLPGANGLEICREYRNAGGSSPILMLTGRVSVIEKETGLDSGADDYLTKPFNLRELGARVKGLLRRPAEVHPSETLTVGGLSLDTATYRVSRNGQSNDLSPDEFQLLACFMRRPHEVFTCESLLKRVWSHDAAATDEIVKSTMHALKKKIDPDEQFLRHVQGTGYRLDAP
jgi:two-component system, OmpR family, response regulator TrcR